VRTSGFIGFTTAVAIATTACGNGGNAGSPSATTTTVTVTTTVTSAADSSRTVDQAIAENGNKGPTDWLKRLRDAGLGKWPLETINHTAWRICDALWAGADYDKVMQQLRPLASHDELMAMYGVAIGFTCKQPPGAPPGYPK